MTLPHHSATLGVARGWTPTASADETTCDEPVALIITDGLRNLLAITEILVAELPDEAYQQFRRSDIEEGTA
jgi:hypothetical protein